MSRASQILHMIGESEKMKKAVGMLQKAIPAKAKVETDQTPSIFLCVFKGKDGKKYQASVWEESAARGNGPYFLIDVEADKDLLETDKIDRLISAVKKLL